MKFDFIDFIQMINIRLPFPPTMNTYWRNFRGRTVLSLRGRKFKKMVGEIVLTSIKKDLIKEIYNKRLEVYIDYFPPDRRKRDLDNYVKAILDGLEEAQVYANDEQIDRLLLNRKEIVKGGYVDVTISSLSAS